MSTRASRLYVIGSDDAPWVKIGISVDPQKRLTVLQTGFPFALSVLWHCEGDFTLEQHLHGVFKDHRMQGEWFDLTPLGDPVSVVREAVQNIEWDEPCLSLGIRIPAVPPWTPDHH
jgi:hypothetical protein